MTLDVPQLLLISAVIAGAAMVKGAIGFGFPLVGIPLLSAIIVLGIVFIASLNLVIRGLLR